MGKVEAEMGMQDFQQTGDDKMLKVNASISLDEFMNLADCPKMLKDILKTAAVWQVRNETSLEKALLAANLVPELTLGLLVLDARIVFEDGSVLPLHEFVQRVGRKGTISSLLLPIKDHLCSASVRIGVSPTSEPVVAAAASTDQQNGVIGEVRLALYGVWSGRQWLSKSADGLKGNRLTTEALQGIAAAVEKEVEPESDYRGSAEYRRAMAGVLTQRALEICMDGGQA